MSRYLNIHPTHPQARLIGQAADALRAGGIAVYPTDSTYAVGCHLGDKLAVDRVRAIRRLASDHLLTLVCRDLSEVATYARVDNASYRIVRRCLPGPFTFVLPATRELPRRLVDRKRKTIGLRVPSAAIAQALLAELDEPMLSTTLQLPAEELPIADVADRRDALDRLVDVIVDGGPCGMRPTTVVDLTGNRAVVLRQGIGQF